MKQKKIKTFGQLCQHLIDSEEGKQIRKGEDGQDKYYSWIYSQLDGLFMDENNPHMTFEIAHAGDTLHDLFRPLKHMFDQLYNSCPRCLKRMEDAYQVQLNQTKKS
jgi:hypothetical protein